MTDSGITRIGLVGSGVMGRRIAYSCVTHGLETRLFDVRPDALPEAAEEVRGLIPEPERDHAMEYLKLTGDLADCVSGVDLVIEAVPENLAIKRQIFTEIDTHVDDGTLLASNASSLPGSRFADVVSHPGNLINVNFSSPTERKVEVMGHPGTAPETLRRVSDFIHELGLVPIVVKKEIIGYVQNRLWRAVKKETLALLAGGYATPSSIDRAWLLDMGGEMGPCAIMDEIGLDVVRDIENVYFGETGDPSDKPPQFLEDMIAAGKLGMKSGEGFYRYPDPEFEQPGWLEGRD